MIKKIGVSILISIMIISTVFMEVGAAVVNQPVPNTNIIETGNNIKKEVNTSNKSNTVKKEEEEHVPKKEEENKTNSSKKEETPNLPVAEENNTENEEGNKVEGNKTEGGVKGENSGSSKGEEEKEVNKEETESGEKEEYITEDELIYSNKYLVKGNNIYRIDPKTSIEEFRKNIEIAEGKEIKIYKEEKEVTEGYICTGMVIKEAKGEVAEEVKEGEKEEKEYTISVIGDINGDGIANQVELTRIIRHVVGLNGWKLEGIERASADITGDGEVNLIDISKLINYIVYGKWDYDAVKTPEAPTIKVISKKEEKEEYYVQKVEIKIEAGKNSKGGKIIYKITGSKEEAEKEIKDGEIITIEGEGEYLVTAYTYGKEGNRSKVANRVIKIKDKYSIIYSPGEEGLFSEQKTEEIKYGEKTPEYKGIIKGKPGYKFVGWEPEVEEIVTKSIEYVAKWEKIQYSIDFGPNGGNFTMPSEGDAQISTEIKEIDTGTDGDTEEGGKNTLEYVWSQDGEKPPEDGWKEFTNGDEIKKSDITEPGIWYVWVEIKDKDGNVVEIIRSDPFIITGKDDPANKITITPDQTEWTNEDVIVKIEYGENLSENKKVTCTGTEGEDYEINEEDGTITVKNNNVEITVEAEDKAGNKIVETITIENIDKEAPTVEIAPNGGKSYTMPTQGKGKISATLTAVDPEATEENGQSGLNILQYAWSQNKEEEPIDWISFTNGEKVEKKDVEKAGTWYLWTKVVDVAGNRAEEVKISEAFTITENTDSANKITITPDKTEWTNEDVIVKIDIGENLSENKKITCTGTEGEDYEINEEDGTITVKNNNVEITVEAEDVAGNKITETITIENIDKQKPVVELAPNGANLTMPSIGEAKINTIITAKDLEATASNGNSGIKTMQYAWSQSKEVEPAEWTNFTSGQKLEKTGITKPETWYLWTKVVDNAGNRAEEIKISKAFKITASTGEGADPANQITLTPDKTKWTNEDVIVTVTYGANITKNKTLICQGTEGKDFETNGEEQIIVKTNQKTVIAIGEDESGNRIVKTLTIANIDKLVPEVEIAPNGRTNYVMPSEGNAKISATLTAKEIEKTEDSGMSGLKTLAYAWSQSNTVEPEEWTDFTNGEKIEKTDIQEAGTWYLWTKVTDVAGNRAEKVKISNPFIIGSSEDPANQIILTADKTEWTNEDVTVTVEYGENLTQNRTLKCEGTEGKDYEQDGIESIVVKTNGKVVTAEAEDIEGNKVVKTIRIENIDRIKPIVSLSPNGGTGYTMPSTGEAKISTVVTAEDPAKTETDGQSNLNILQYAWSQSKEEEPENWTDFTNGEKIEKTGITETGSWYLWTKVVDKAGNRSEEIKVSKEFKITSNTEIANQIILTADQTNWINEDVTVTAIFGSNLTQNKTLTSTGTEGADYEIHGVEEVVVKTNGKTITATAEDVAGNKIVVTLTIANIDKVLPVVTLSPNGGNYTMPSTGDAKINTSITAEDPAKTETSGQSKLKTLTYAWSQSKEEEPEEWIEFTNGEKVEKTGITEPGTWYLWTKVVDHAGNRAEEIKISNSFKITASTGEGADPANQITLTADKTEWTNEDVMVTIEYGANLTQNRNVMCTGEDKEDYVIEGENKAIVKTNGKMVTAEAEDIAGNKIVASLNITNIDKLLPTVNLSPNGANLTMPSTGAAKINTILTANDPEATQKSGKSGLNILEYAWSQSKTEEPGEWIEFTNGEKVEKTGILETGIWYLWTKVEDVAGNRAEEIKVSKAFKITASTGEGADPANQITLEADKTTWTNEDVTVTINYGENLTQNKKVTCRGTEGNDYVINGVGEVIVKTNGETVTAEAEDVAGNKIVASLNILNIDKQLPVVTLDRNGGNFSMPTIGEAKINTTLTAVDPEATEVDGKSDLKTLQYAWSRSNTQEPEEWKTFRNGEKVEKSGISQPEIWYLWTKVEDVAGNRAEQTKVSEAFKITSNTESPNQITFTPDPSDWTNTNVNVTINYGENLIGEKTVRCSGTARIDCEINGTTNVIIKNNNQEIIVVAEDGAGNQVIASHTILNIDRIEPEVELYPNGGTYSMPRTGNGSIRTYLRAEDQAQTSIDGKSDLDILQYAWSQSRTEEPEEWINFNNKTEIEKTDITEEGTWYLWTKVVDKAGNRATNIKVSNPFIVLSSKQILLEADKTEWTNQDVIVTATYEEGVRMKRLTCMSFLETTGEEEGKDFVINGTEKAVVKSNGMLVLATGQDSAGNQTEAKYYVGNIDKQAPVITLSLNGGNFTMPTVGTAKINTILTAEDPITATSGSCGIKTLEYAWSTSNTEEPSNWTSFASGEWIEKTGITGPETWYLWTRGIDEIGNTETKVSEAFIITGNDDPNNTIILTRDPDSWTNQDVTVTAEYGRNLVQNKKLTSTGADDEIRSVEEALIKTNGNEVTAEAEDAAGNLITKTIQVRNIDKIPPTMTVNLKSDTTYTKEKSVTITVGDEGGSGLSSSNSYQYYLSTSSTTLTGGSWVNYTSGTANTIGTDLTGTYYLFVKSIKDVAGSTNTADGTNKTINGITYYQYGPYYFDNKAPTAGTLTMKLDSSTGSNYTNNTWTNKNVYIAPVNGSDEHSQHKTTVYSISGPIKVSNQTGARTLTEEGTYTVTVTTTDNAGNTASREYTIKIDKTAPTAGTLTMKLDSSTGSNYTNDTWTNQNVYIAPVNGSDAASQHNTTVYSISGKITATNQTGARTLTEEGTYTVEVTTTDNAGNSASRTYTIKIDKTAPEAGTLTMKLENNVGNAYTSDTWTNKSVYIALNNGSETASTTASGYKTTVYSISGPITASNQTGARTLTEEGTYTVTVTTTDNAGNTASREYTIKIDKTAPTAGTLTMKLDSSTGSNYTNDTWTNQNVYIAPVNGSDAASQHNTTVYSISGKITATNQTGARTLTEEGTYTVEVTTTDNAGNSASRTYKIKIDKTPPTAGTLTMKLGNSGGSNYTNNTWTNQNVYIKATGGSDSLSGYASTVYSVGNVAGPINGTTLSTTGTHNVEVTTTDNAGNTASRTYTIKIDKTPPTVKLKTSTLNWTKNNVTLSGEVTDTGGSGIAAYQYSTSSTTPTTGWITSSTIPTKVVTSSGTWYLHVKDGAGNTKTSNSIEVKIDTEPPVITKQLSATDSASSITNMDLSIGVKDEGSGLWKIEWYYKLSGTSTYTKAEDTICKGEQTEQTKNTTLTGLISGRTYYIYAKVYDWVEKVTTTDIIEVVAPTARWENITTSKQYSTMEAAFSELKLGEILKLLTSYTDNSNPVYSTSDVGLNNYPHVNLSGNTVTTSNTIRIESGTLYLANGTIRTEEDINLITNNAKLHLGEGGKLFSKRGTTIYNTSSVSSIDSRPYNNSVYILNADVTSEFGSAIECIGSGTVYLEGHRTTVSSYYGNAISVKNGLLKVKDGQISSEREYAIYETCPDCGGEVTLSQNRDDKGNLISYGCNFTPSDGTSAYQCTYACARCGINKSDVIAFWGGCIHNRRYMETDTVNSRVTFGGGTLKAKDKEHLYLVPPKTPTGYGLSYYNKGEIRGVCKAFN